jgi:membrane-associated phospholipid phosphatase
MSSNRERTARLRVEDVLTLAVIGGMLLFAHTRAALAHITIAESDWWELSFIFLPAALLVFAASWQFAFGSVRPALDSTLRRIGTIARDWLPFGIFLIVYESFRSHLWQSLLGPDRDAMLLALDRRLFGETPAVTLQRLITPWLTDTLVIAYFLHLVLPAILAVSLYRQGLGKFRAFLLAVFLAGAIGSTGYLLVPATGPAVAFPELFTVPLSGRVEGTLLGLIDAARAPRDVFPSLHVGISAITLWYARKNGRRWLWCFLPLVLGNWLATVYLRYHYLVDVFAGWLCAVLAIALAELALRWERRRTA